MPSKSKRYGGGSVYEYKRGGVTKFRWQAWIPVNPLDPNGEKKRVGQSGFRTGRDAQRALEDALQTVKEMKPVKASEMPLGEYAKAWLEDLALANTTKYGYEKIVRVHIEPHLGPLPLSKINTNSIARFYKEKLINGRKDSKDMGGPLSSNTVNKIHIVLGSILQKALEERLIGTNPARESKIVNAPTGKAIRAEAEELTTWTASHLREFLTWAHQNQNDELFTLWQLIATTGVRRGEALALQWGDIDFSNQSLSIRRSTDAVVSQGVKKTKTGHSRNIILFNETIKELKRFKEVRSILGLSFVQPQSYIFSTVRNKLRTPNDTTARWSRLVARAQKDIPELPWLTLKGLRHTHATLLLQSGVSAKIVQERLGHSNIGTTLNTYTHVTPTIQREAIVHFENWTRNV
jgi:integrase